MPSCVSGCRTRAMVLDYTLAGAVTLGILAYLVYALVRPEKF
jgi:K+-transporting ATPase ATPase F chain